MSMMMTAMRWRRLRAHVAQRPIELVHEIAPVRQSREGVVKARVIEGLLQTQALLHLRRELLIDRVQRAGAHAPGPRASAAARGSNRECRRPTATPGTRAGRFPRRAGTCRKPAGARADRNLQVASGKRLPRPADRMLGPDRIGQRLRTRADEDARPRAARLDLRQLEVIAHVDQAGPDGLSAISSSRSP